MLMVMVMILLMVMEVVIIMIKYYEGYVDAAVNHDFDGDGYDLLL
jgi:hypothetical protein